MYDDNPQLFLTICFLSVLSFTTLGLYIVWYIKRFWL